MSLGYKNIIAVVVAVICLSFLRCGFRGGPEDEVWGVLVSGLPEKIGVQNAIENLPYYILKQTHEPIFKVTDGQNFSSNVLKTWSRSPLSGRYLFCPDTSLRFNASVGFTTEFLRAHLQAITTRYTSGFKIKEEGACVSVLFDSPASNYLEFLSQYENAPTVITADSHEDGLGAYTIVSVEKDRIVLERKLRGKFGYNKIIFYDYKGASDPRLTSREIKDFNMIPSREIPEWVRDNFVSFNNAELKSVNLVINHPSVEARKFAYNCIDVSAMRKILAPLNTDFNNIQTVLPMGVPGAKSGLPTQECRYKPGSAGGVGTLVFGDYDQNAKTAFEKLFAEIYSKTGVRIKTAIYPAEVFASVVHKKTSPINIFVVVANAIRPEETVFLEPFVSSGRYYRFNLGGLGQKYTQMQKETDYFKKQAIGIEIAEGIKDQALVLPLYQHMKRLYYPKAVKNVVLGKGFTEYPEVADLKW